MSGAATAPKRTFSVVVETRRDNLRDMIDGDCFVIHADPLETPAEGGGTNISMGFPVLVVTPWVAGGEAFAALVAKLLEERQP